MNQTLSCIGMVALLSAGLESPGFAQVVPDASLSTVVSQGNGLHFVVTGGRAAGANLFHSFDRLSVPLGSRLEFEQAPHIETIFGRVTGVEASSIDGILQAGTSLYLLNPNGIIFGPGAELQLGGDLVASTALEIQFSDGLTWKSSPGVSPGASSLDSSLLSVAAPTGLQLGAKSGNIDVQARGRDSTGNAVGLAVSPGHQVSLVGREVSLEQGFITAPGGLISLVGLGEGSVALADGAVDLSLSGFPLVLPVNDSARDLASDSARDAIGALAAGGVYLGQGSLVSTSGSGGNGVRVVGDRITLNEQSRILADNWGVTEGQGITMEARQLTLSDQSLLASSAFSSGQGGPIALQVHESIELVGTGYANLEQSLVLSALTGQSRLTSRDRLTGLVTGARDSGDSGAIAVTAPRLHLKEGAAIWAPSFGAGQGGDINLQIASWLGHSASAIASSAHVLGKAGDLKIETDHFELTQSAFLNTSTFSPAPGGSVEIRAGQLTLENPRPDSVVPNAIFSSSIGSTGIPGDVTIDSQRLSASSGSQITSTGGADLSIAFIDVGGPGGNVSINAAEQVFLTGGTHARPTQLSVTSYSDFPAGSLKITTPLLIVQGGARLLATSSVGEGGNISVESGELVLLRNGSDITAAAIGVGDGGNIDLETRRLLLLDNSQITANATQGLGGTIDVSSQLLLRSKDSSITASSALGQDFGGRVQLSQAQVDPAQLSPSLPRTLLDKDEDHIVAACNPEHEAQFVVSGRGGLPTGAWRALESRTLWQDGRSAHSPPVPQPLLSQSLLSQPPLSQPSSGQSSLESANGAASDKLRPLARPGAVGLEAIAFEQDASGRVALIHRPSKLPPATSSALLSPSEICQNARQHSAG